MAITDYASLRQAVIDWPSLSGEPVTAAENNLGMNPGDAEPAQ